MVQRFRAYGGRTAYAYQRVVDDAIADAIKWPGHFGSTILLADQPTSDFAARRIAAALDSEPRTNDGKLIAAAHRWPSRLLLPGLDQENRTTAFLKDVRRDPDTIYIQDSEDSALERASGTSWVHVGYQTGCDIVVGLPADDKTEAFRKLLIRSMPYFWKPWSDRSQHDFIVDFEGEDVTDEFMLFALDEGNFPPNIET